MRQTRQSASADNTDDNEVKNVESSARSTTDTGDLEMKDAQVDDDVPSSDQGNSHGTEAFEHNGSSSANIEIHSDMSIEDQKQEGLDKQGLSDSRAEAFDAESLSQFLEKMDDHPPIIPDIVIDYYLSTAGVNCPDKRIKRLLAFAAQKFLADIAQDAYQYSKIRHGSSSGGGSGGSKGSHGGGKLKGDKNKSVLTMEYLSAALSDYGINIQRPEFFR